MSINNYNILSTTPTIPASVYQNLPEFLKDITDQFNDSREKDIVLTSSIAVLGGCFNNIQGKYHNDWVRPNLYIFVVAPPASAKSAMKYPKLLGKEIQDKLMSVNKDSKCKYDLEVKKWDKQSKKGKANVGSPPSKPKFQVLFLPGNSSASSIYNLLDQNNGKGIICETEADTLSGAIEQDWGNFSHLLRSAFHHEDLTLSRKTNTEYISIVSPGISTLLSGTPDQVPRLIASTEDGLCSRFLFYCYSRELKWIDPTPCSDCKDLRDYFEALSVSVANIKKELDVDKFTFTLTDKQFSILSANFSKKLEEIKLFEGDGAGSAVYRLGIISFRIAMILTVLRNINNLSKSTNLECSDQDFETAMSLIDVYFQHSMVMYSLLPKQTSAKVNPRLRQFYTLLPTQEKFTRKKANEIGAAIGIKERTVGNYLSHLIKGGFLSNPEYGMYKNLS